MVVWFIANIIMVAVYLYLYCLYVTNYYLHQIEMHNI